MADAIRVSSSASFTTTAGTTKIATEIGTLLADVVKAATNDYQLNAANPIAVQLTAELANYIQASWGLSAAQESTVYNTLLKDVTAATNTTIDKLVAALFVVAKGQPTTLVTNSFGNTFGLAAIGPIGVEETVVTNL